MLRIKILQLIQKAYGTIWKECFTIQHKYTKGSKVGQRKIKEANILEYYIIRDKLVKLASCKIATNFIFKNI